jgi:3-oxoacyl-[acyl-carrier-protein] synthase II
MNKAYVVGYSLIDALGNTPEECFANMINDQDYSRDLDFMIAENHKITRGIYVDDANIPTLPDSPKGMTKMQRMGLYATDYALKMSKLPLSRNVAVVFSTIVNDLETIDEVYTKLTENKRLNPRHILNRIPDMMPSHVATYFQFMGQTTSVYCACATGINSIDYAMRLVDEYDYVIVGAGDAGCLNMPVRSFHAFGAMSNHSSPFDDSRNGFVMGDGASVLILQSDKKVCEYNSQVYATLYPPGMSNDAHDATSPAQDGRGAHLAITKALSQVDGPIHAINAHATSTPIGDIIEYQVCVEHFGPTPIYAPKGKIGHTMAGCGIVETVYAIESMRQQIIPHVHNLKDCGYDSYNCIVREPQKFPNEATFRTLNNSFGFGGKCASQVIEVSRSQENY